MSCKFCCKALQSFLAKSIIFISLNIKLLLQNSHLNCSELINDAFQWSPASENNNRLWWIKCTHTFSQTFNRTHTWWLLWGSEGAGTVSVAGLRSPSGGRAGNRSGSRRPCCLKRRRLPSSPEITNKMSTQSAVWAYLTFVALIHRLN